MDSLHSETYSLLIGEAVATLSIKRAGPPGTACPQQQHLLLPGGSDSPDYRDRLAAVAKLAAEAFTA